MPVGSSVFAPVSRANYFYGLGSYMPNYGSGPLNNCSNTLCYTYNHDYIYKPHTAVGMVGTISAVSRAQKRRV
jgi:hypothetical protein